MFYCSQIQRFDTDLIFKNLLLLLLLLLLLTYAVNWPDMAFFNKKYFREIDVSLENQTDFKSYSIKKLRTILNFIK